MYKLVQFIEQSYQRSLDQVGDDDPYFGPGCLGIKDVLKAHYLIADLFYAQGNDLGGIGPKSMDLLHSALFRQYISYGGKKKWQTKYDVCATLFYGLIKNHQFHDANKRTAFLSLIFHLQTLNLCPTISQICLEEFSVDVASNNLSKFSRYRDLENKYADKSDAEVFFVSYFLKKILEISLPIRFTPTPTRARMGANRI